MKRNRVCAFGLPGRDIPWSRRRVRFSPALWRPKPASRFTWWMRFAGVCYSLAASICRRFRAALSGKRQCRANDHPRHQRFVGAPAAGASHRGPEQHAEIAARRPVYDRRHGSRNPPRRGDSAGRQEAASASNASGAGSTGRLRRKNSAVRLGRSAGLRKNWWRSGARLDAQSRNPMPKSRPSHRSTAPFSRLATSAAFGIAGFKSSIPSANFERPLSILDWRLFHPVDHITSSGSFDCSSFSPSCCCTAPKMSGYGVAPVSVNRASSGVHCRSTS